MPPGRGEGPIKAQVCLVRGAPPTSTLTKKLLAWQFRDETMLDVRAVPTRPSEVGTGIPFRRSLAWRMILPIPLVAIIGMAVIWCVVPHVVVDIATDGAVTASQQIATQFKIIRTYYTENIVNKINKEGTF
jgi:hypothetical protein